MGMRDRMRDGENMKVAVGSINPIKVQAVKEAFQETFEEMKVIEIKVDSS